MEFKEECDPMEVKEEFDLLNVKEEFDIIGVKQEQEIDPLETMGDNDDLQDSKSDSFLLISLMSSTKLFLIFRSSSWISAASDAFLFA